MIYWCHLRHILKASQGHFTEILGIFCGYFGCIQGTSLDNYTAIQMGMDIVLAASLLRLRAMFQQFKKKGLGFKISICLFFCSIFHKILFKMGLQIIKIGKLPLNTTQIWSFQCLVHFALSIIVTDTIFVISVKHKNIDRTKKIQYFHEKKNL